jgi:hypothetical protein
MRCTNGCESALGEGHWVGGDRGPPDSDLVYFADIEIAHAFCEAFGCGRIEVGGYDASLCSAVIQTCAPLQML